MVKWAIITILLLPVAEIAVFFIVVAVVGWLWAFGLMFATSLAGFVVLRQAGRGRIARFRVAVADTGITGIEAHTHGFLTVLAGLLLFLPGFLTDLVGAALLISPVRRWCAGTFRRLVRSRDRTRNSVIDLAPGEWRQVPERERKGERSRNGRDDTASG
jgi:UPF0716 protein FxsA